MSNLPLSKYLQGLDRNTSNEIKTSINQAFVYGFRLVMLICAGLSVLGAAQSWWLIPVSEPTTQP